MMNPQQQQQQQQQQHHPQHSSHNQYPHPHEGPHQVSMMSSAVPSSYSSVTTMLAPSGITQQQQAIFNGVNPHYPGLRLLHNDPPVFSVHDFLTPQECQFLIESAMDSFCPAPVVGKGAGEVSMTRTSSTCYLAREDLPDLMRKVSYLTGKPMEHMELPQVGRYLPTQQYYQHYDAFNLDEEDGRRFAANGGQRTVTVLIYLNDVARGGQTAFPTLQFEITPVRGMALVFFPATVDGVLDPRTLHAALPAVDDKFVSQIWIRQYNYYGQPSKRLTDLMGMPLTVDEVRAIPPWVGGTTAVSPPGSGVGLVAGADTMPVIQQPHVPQGPPGTYPF